MKTVLVHVNLDFIFHLNLSTKSSSKL